MNRLRTLETHPGYQVPQGYPVPRSHTDLLELQKNFLRHEVAPELIEDRLNIFDENLRRFRTPPAWLTLEAQQDLSDWRNLVVEVMKVEDFGINAFKEVLVHKSLGRYEANRILFHLLKDSYTKRDHEEVYRPSKTKWMYSCSHEAQSAMRNWQDWDCEYMKRLGKRWVKGDNGRWAWEDARTSSSARSSSTWGGHRGFR